MEVVFGVGSLTGNMAERWARADDMAALFADAMTREELRRTLFLCAFPDAFSEILFMSSIVINRTGENHHDTGYDYTRV